MFKQIVESKSIRGFSAVTENKSEMSGEGKIAALWQRFAQEIMSNTSQHSPCYAIYYDYRSDVDDTYRVLIGSESTTQGDMVRIQPGKYHEFRAQGEMPQTVISLWQDVWDYYRHHPDEKRAYCTDVEYYEAENSVCIYIGIVEE